MMTSVLLGVDIGTTNLKAVAFSPQGEALATASQSTPTHHPRTDWAEYDPEELWTVLCEIIGKVVKTLGDGSPVAAVAFTGMAEAGVPLDKQGTPLFPAISWFDRRALKQLDHWIATIGVERTALITGLPTAPAAGVLRLLWFRDNHPELFNRTARWLNLPDYAAYRLCSEQATEFSLASRMMLLDINQRSWSEELLSELDLPAEILAPLAESGSVIGLVTAEGAAQTGLPAGIPVCAGGHDHLCAAAALGVVNYGDLFDSIGTAEALIAAVPPGPVDPTNAEAGIAQGIHILPDQHYVISGNVYGGGSFEWVTQLLCSLAAAQDIDNFNEVIRRATDAPLGSGGVFFLAHLRQANPPTMDPLSRGAFIGLSSQTESGHIARAVIEGLAYEYQIILDEVTTRFDFESRRLVATGGGTRNALLMQVKADVSGLPVSIPSVDEATCLGAAIAAGIGVGVYQNYRDAHQHMVLTERVVMPNAINHRRYKIYYNNIYRHLYEALRGMNRKISAQEPDAQLSIEDSF